MDKAIHAVKKIGAWFAPPPAKSEDDGRDQWPSRTAFVLASCGGAIGMGNMLRFPSQVFNNHGLQWFIPYLMAIFLIAIPCLVLEIAIGQAYRGGCVIAYNNMSNRLKGTGMGLIYVGFIVVVYFVPILAWIMVYFRCSFTSPLPWTGRVEEFYMQDVIANPDPIPGNFSADGDSVVDYTEYPATGVLGEIAGWCAFTWFVVWLCMFRGVGLTGRVVYFTMGLPIVMAIILIGRSCSLENAGRGVKLYFGSWDSSQLGAGKIWQTACGQVFFSTGVGFGYYTAYASYNRKYSNAVQDAVIIVCSNCSFETIAAFAVFGVIGFLGMNPDEMDDIGSFTIGFLTYPAAIVEMPGANFWAVLFFFTLMLLGISSSFAMLDAVMTLIMDSEWGGKGKFSRPVVATTLVIASFLLSLMYCTEFGYYLMDGVDRWLNNITLVFVVWSECVAATVVYRYKDVVSEVGLPAYIAYNAGYFGGQVFGVAVAHAVIPAAGAGLGFGLYVLGFVVSLLIAKTPDQKAPSIWNKNVFLSRLWYLGFYQGNQLRHDLNVIVGAGKNWNIPNWWAPILRYIAAPILAIVFSFAYPEFYTLRDDPVYIFGFIIAHFGILLVGIGFILPKWFDVFVPAERRNEGYKTYAPNVLMGTIEAESDDRLEASSDEKVPKD
ncbi:putative sodium/chloride dependent neurotransmitter transporter [Lineolata rhizophorae]|uniref:Putative sodium/chloride dependent neurotransmitter transporter n=1 Tax=Lineolata rhizophorae TaxID=578093 RepID=A0A6A6NL02_9PEZI|nr:putative sodium/chloride dependent neurotransmitter transporter [Lineolata rhizophorae]